MAEVGGTVKWILDVDNSKFEKGLTDAQSKLNKIADNFGKIGSTLTRNVTLPIIALGTSFIAAGNAVDKMHDEIVTATGASGRALDNMLNIGKRIGKQVPQSFEQVGLVIGDLNTRLNLSGKELEKAAKLMLDYARVNKLDVAEASRTSTRLLNALGKEASELPMLLDKLQVASIKSGIAVNQLADFIIGAGPSFDDLGFGLNRSIELFSRFEKFGARPEELIGSMSKAMRSMIEQGANNPAEAFAGLIRQIKEAPNALRAAELGFKFFGRTGDKIAEDIRAGRFDVGEWEDALEAAGGTVSDLADRTLSFSEKMGILRNQTTLALEPIGVRLLDAFDKLLPSITGVLEKVTGLAEWFSNLSPRIQTNIFAAVGLLAALGPLFLIIGGIIKSVVGLIGFVKILGGVFTFLLSPIGLVLLAITALAFAAFMVIRHWESIKGFFVGLVKFIANVLEGATRVITAPFEAAFGIIKKGVDAVKGFLNKLNPFARFSPSLVDQVSKGTRVIADLYKDAFADIKTEAMKFNAPIETSLVPTSVGGGTENINIVFSGPISVREGDKENIAEAVGKQVELYLRGARG